MYRHGDGEIAALQAEMAAALPHLHEPGLL